MNGNNVVTTTFIFTLCLDFRFCTVYFDTVYSLDQLHEEHPELNFKHY